MAEKKRIIVIDDDQDFSMLMQCLLEDRFEVTQLSDGLEAVKKAASEKPDLIMTDVMMPGISGIEVLRTLAMEEETRGIPVLVLTGSHFNPSTEQLFKQEGNVRGFLSKTLPLELILQRVVKICGGQ